MIGAEQQHDGHRALAHGTHGGLAAPVRLCHGLGASMS